MKEKRNDLHRKTFLKSSVGSVAQRVENGTGFAFLGSVRGLYYYSAA